MAITIACIQPQVHSNRKECYSEIKSLISQVLNNSQECDIFCLPERWVPLSKDISRSIQQERGEDYKFIKSIAKDFGINIISGAIWEKRNHKMRITSYLFSEDGEELGRQDKIHLYAYEKEFFEPSTELNIFKTKTFTFSILICFDMAFFETPRLAVENGAEILFSPTQIREEGMENWEIYLKARALENRVPLAACNTLGSFFNRTFIGKSKIITFKSGFISPSKLKIYEAPSNESGYVVKTIDLEFPKKLREIRLEEKIDKNEIKVQIIDI